MFSRLEFQLDMYEYVKFLSDIYFYDCTMKSFELIFNSSKGVHFFIWFLLNIYFSELFLHVIYVL